MATSSRSTERFKYGICLNDECPLCKEKKIQQIPMRKDLVCTNPDCGKPLRECPPPKTGPNKKLIAIITAAVLGIAAIICVIFALTNKQPKGDGGGDETDSIPPKKVEIVVALNHTEKMLKVGESDTLIATVTPADVHATLVWQASKKSNAVEVSEGIVKAKEVGESKVQVKAIVGTDTVKAVCAYTIEAAEKEVIQEPEKSRDKKSDGEERGNQTFVRGASLGYGTYTGEVKPGTKIPHGHGTITYRSSHAIAGGYKASPGDKYEGEFRDGRPSGGIGYWTHDGNITTINP